MPHNEVSPRERLLYDIEQTLDDLDSEERNATFAHELLAERGKPAVTSLYADCIMAIDCLPKVFEWQKLGKTGLSASGREMLETVDNSIQLNPLYNAKTYRNARLKLNPNEDTPPDSYLVNLNKKSKFAERSLAALRCGVLNGFSAKAPSDAEWLTYRPESAYRTAMVNGSIDPDIALSLNKVRSEREWPVSEYVSNLLYLADLTTNHILRPQESALSADTNGSRKPNSISATLIKESSIAGGAAIVTEMCILAGTQRPSVAAAAGAFAITGVIRGLHLGIRNELNRLSRL